MNCLHDVSEIVLHDVYVEEIEMLPVIEVVETLLKHIDYCGHRLIVPSRFNYLAADGNGVLIAFVNEPRLENEVWVDSSFSMKITTSKEPIENWKESVMKI